ncbi:1-aminocyclopropane-1-carboxylate deaminase [Nitratiruptor sp. YY08-14]|nr:1-aminocyclopropane-1-carboxylate deaminase [Nitratiruptor sp. YY08-10]BCD63788.1 1-aminocyclopropane-1-carboxylate deaminase [Nitratiruptor sp. YY08-14]
MFKPSPVETVRYKNLSFYLKRDDLLHPDFSGNKARKLFFLLHNPPKNIQKIISYGSMQSNAMYSLSVIAKMRGWEFEYYTRINEKLLQNPKGNLKAALKNGMKLKDIRHWTLDIGDLNLLSECKTIDDVVIVPEGARCKEAEEGIKLLAQEIMEWAENENIKQLNIFLPSGTGTTALFLQKNLSRFQVFAVPCVGDKEYLKKQFFALEADEKFHPTILEPPKKYHFGKLYKELFAIWQKLKEQTGVEFDLLYDPIAFKTIISNSRFPIPFLYIHQGGLKGNETMIERYKKKFDTIR